MCVLALFTQTLNCKITIYAIHAEIQRKVNFMGSNFFVAHLVVLFHFLAAGGGKRHPIGWGMMEGEWGCHRVPPFF